MNINFFRAFLDVAKYKSITKAAEIANISQPALSQQIKAIEQSFSCTLFDRTHKGVTLTDEGEVVFKYANKLVGCYDKMTLELKNLEENRRNRLVVAATPVIASYALPCTLFDIKNNFDNYDIELQAHASELVEHEVVEGLADVGFIVDKPQDENLYAQPVFEDELILVASPDLNIPDSLSIDELYSYQILMLNRGQKTRSVLRKAFLPMGLDESRLRIPYELDSTESIKTSAIRGFGLAFLPYMTIKKELYAKQLIPIQLNGFKCPATYYLIRKKITDDLIKNHTDLLLYIEREINKTKC